MVSLDKMPSPETSIGQLYEDTLITTFLTHLFESDPYLKDVTASSWADVSVPNDYEEYVMTHDTGSTSQGKKQQMTAAYKELSDVRQDIVKSLADEYGAGAGADEWTYDDAVEVSSASKSAVKRAMSDELKDDWARQVGKEGRSKLWKLEESPYKDGKLVADGGHLEYPWDEAVELLEIGDIFDVRGRDRSGPDVAGMEPKDWFAEPNREALASLYETVSGLMTTFVDLRSEREELDTNWARYGERTKRTLVDGRLEQLSLRESKLKDLREDVLRTLREQLKGVFSQLGKLVSQAFRDCMKHITLDREDPKVKFDEHKPDLVRKKCKQRLDAKEFALLQTHLGPLIDLPPSDASKNHDHIDRIYKFENTLRSFLKWLWKVYEDIVGGHRTVDVSVEENTEPIGGLGDLMKEVLSEKWGQPSSFGLDDAVTWDELTEELNERLPEAESYDVQDVYQTARELHERLQDNEDTWVGLRVWDEAEKGDEPVIKIKIVREDEYVKRWVNNDVLRPR